MVDGAPIGPLNYELSLSFESDVLIIGGWGWGWRTLCCRESEESMKKTDQWCPP